MTPGAKKGNLWDDLRLFIVVGTHTVPHTRVVGPIVVKGGGQRWL
jgi:hypothetical protein